MSATDAHRRSESPMQLSHTVKVLPMTRAGVPACLPTQWAHGCVQAEGFASKQARPCSAGGEGPGDEIGDRAWNIVNRLAEVTLGGEARAGGRPGSRRAQSLQVLVECA